MLLLQLYLWCKCTVFSSCHFLISNGRIIWGWNTVSLSAVRSSNRTDSKWQVVSLVLPANAAPPPWRWNFFFFFLRHLGNYINAILYEDSWLWGRLPYLWKSWLVHKPKCFLKPCKLGKGNLDTASYLKLKFTANTRRNRLKYLLIFCLTYPCYGLCLLRQNLCKLKGRRGIRA